MPGDDDSTGLDSGCGHSQMSARTRNDLRETGRRAAPKSLSPRSHIDRSLGEQLWHTLKLSPQISSRAFIAPDKILVATDLTDIDYLIPHAKAQCEASGASLVLCHVIQPVDSGSLDAAVVFIADAAKAATQRLLEAARKTLGEVAAQMRADGIDCEVVIRHGHPRDVVKELVGHVHARTSRSGYAWST